MRIRISSQTLHCEFKFEFKFEFIYEFIYEFVYEFIYRPPHCNASSVLQCVVVCCSVLQCVAVCCSVSPKRRSKGHSVTNMNSFVNSNMNSYEFIYEFIYKFIYEFIYRIERALPDKYGIIHVITCMPSHIQIHVFVT